MERGFHKPGDVENGLGYYLGKKLGDRRDVGKKLGEETRGQTGRSPNFLSAEIGERPVCPQFPPPPSFGSVTNLSCYGNSRSLS